MNGSEIEAMSQGHLVADPPAEPCAAEPVDGADPATPGGLLSSYGTVFPNSNEAGRDEIKTADGCHLAVGIFRR